MMGHDMIREVAADWYRLQLVLARAGCRPEKWMLMNMEEMYGRR